MERETETPFSREPWQRLLQEGGESPPESTDARIRKAARRALPPRISRWWLPASLAASVLLAMLIVEQQYDERESAEVVIDSAYTRPPAPAPMPAASARREEDAAQAPAGESPAPQLARERARTKQEAGRQDTLREFAPDPRMTAESSSSDAASSSGKALGDVAVTDTRIRGPEREIEESSEMPLEARAAESPPAYVAPQSRYSPAVAKSRAPEDWYAEIEKLRAAGRTEEADRELERLKEAHPGWLERHLEKDKSR
jgi:hypothetical protein